jgi:tRNA threonylcarbamoyladenosine biosynthesis protein TsaE
MPGTSPAKNRLPVEKEYGLNELPELVKSLYDEYGQIRIWVLEGMLGAGKTTLVQHLGKELLIAEDIISPTFSILNEYASGKEEKVFHLDLYRLKNISELDEIGLQEIAESGYFCLIEWASAVGYVPVAPWLEIRLEHLPNTRRKIKVFLHEN